MTITVDEYINSFYQQIQINLIKLRKIIKETAPEAQEKISWGVPTYFQDGFLVQFAAYKKHIGFYTSCLLYTSNCHNIIHDHYLQYIQ